jgi:hypothetical protein
VSDEDQQDKTRREGWTSAGSAILTGREATERRTERVEIDREALLVLCVLAETYLLSMGRGDELRRSVSEEVPCLRLGDLVVVHGRTGGVRGMVVALGNLTGPLMVTVDPDQIDAGLAPG